MMEQDRVSGESGAGRAPGAEELPSGWMYRQSQVCWAAARVLALLLPVLHSYFNTAAAANTTSCSVLLRARLLAACLRARLLAHAGHLRGVRLAQVGGAGKDFHGAGARVSGIGCGMPGVEGLGRRM